MEKELLNIEEYKELKENKKILIVEFGTSLCVACTGIRYKIEEWIKTHKEVDYIYISCEEEPEIAASESIFSAPAVLVFVEGRLTVRESGYFSIESIFAKIEKYIDLLIEKE